MDHENVDGGQMMKGTATQQNHKMKSKQVKRRAERRNMMAMLTLAPA